MSKYITNYARDELLIALVKSNPNLYDSNWSVPVEDLDGRTSVRSREDTWLDITDEVDKLYPASMYELQSIEEKAAYLKGRWKNIRNVFVRELSKTTASQWPLYDACLWYEPYYVRKKPYSMNSSMPVLALDELPGFSEAERSEAKHDSRVSEQTAISSPPSSDDIQVTTPSVSQARKRPFLDGPASQRSDVVFVSERTEHLPKASRATTAHMTSNSDMHDECAFFGMQVASYLRKLPDHKALEAKSEVLKALSKHF